MKIMITGASGFIGKQLTPQLSNAGFDLVLVGRDKSRLSNDFPGSTCIDYNEISQALKTSDIVLHLSSINSNSKLSVEEFKNVNVDLLMLVAQAARKAKVKRFINISTVHALQLENNSYYAHSKREGVKALNAMRWPAVENVYLPAAYGKIWVGKLSILNKLPYKLARAIFSLSGSLKPVVNINHLFEYVSSGPVSQLNDNEIILHDDKSNNIFYAFMRRAVDLSFVVFVFVFLWWLMLLVWIVIRFTSSGPGLFKQTRVGKKQNLFQCYKFRTMLNGTKSVGTHNVSVSSITPIGSFLRKTKIDELPQIINILRNEVSLIGPRPCLPTQLELIKEREALNVFSIKPGITGLGQINNIDMSNPKILAQWDSRYISLRGLFLDAKIIIATALGSGQGDKINDNSQ